MKIVKLTNENLVQQLPKIFGPNSIQYLPKVVKALAKVTGKESITILPNALSIDSIIVPFGDFGHQVMALARYSTKEVYLHAKEHVPLIMLVSELGRMIQRIHTNRYFNGDMDIIPAAIAERVCFEVLAPKRMDEFFALIELTATRYKFYLELVNQRISKVDALKEAGLPDTLIYEMERYLRSEEISRTNRNMNWLDLMNLYWKDGIIPNL